MVCPGMVARWSGCMHVAGGELGVRSAALPTASVSTLFGDRAGAGTPMASVITVMALAPPMRPSTASCGRAESGRCAWAYTVSSVSSVSFTLVDSRSASAAAASAPAAFSAWSVSTSATRRSAAEGGSSSD